MNAIDLYSGIGGWTLGMKLSGINNVASYEWWHEANHTHNLNFETNHKEVNIRKINVRKDLIFDHKIDIVVGSPPCTQFSYANKGGNGNIQEGLVDIFKFLEVVEYLKPKYWVMENVPRVAKILKKELDEGCLRKFHKLVKIIQVVDSADYGVPQNRKRMIAGDFPISLFQSYKGRIKAITFGDVFAALAKENETIIDPNFGNRLLRSEITELENEADLTKEEVRINMDSKTYHPIYNKMSFPDSLNRPSRTVTATCTRVSRESIIVQSNSGYRRLNVRERGVLQSFPLTYQFYGRTLNSKFKMIGNAVPPILTYYVFQSMLGKSVDDLESPKASIYRHIQPRYKAYKSKLGLPAKKYPDKRKFQFSVPHLRYGSGVRFELSNNSDPFQWSFKFFHGNSKNIKQVELNNEVKEILAPVINTSRNQIFTERINQISLDFNEYSSERLQEFWTSSKSNNEVFNFLDRVGKCVQDILETVDLGEIESNLVESIVHEKNKKLEDNKVSLLVGFYFLSSLNNKLFAK